MFVHVFVIMNGNLSLTADGGTANTKYIVVKNADSLGDTKTCDACL